jgi:hypothetical protein
MPILFAVPVRKGHIALNMYPSFQMSFQQLRFCKDDNHDSHMSDSTRKFVTSSLRTDLGIDPWRRALFTSAEVQCSSRGAREASQRRRVDWLRLFFSRSYALKHQPPWCFSVNLPLEGLCDGALSFSGFALVSWLPLRSKSPSWCCVSVGVLTWLPPLWP